MEKQDKLFKNSDVRMTRKNLKNDKLGFYFMGVRIATVTLEKQRFEGDVRGIYPGAS